MSKLSDQQQSSLKLRMKFLENQIVTMAERQKQKIDIQDKIDKLTILKEEINEEYISLKEAKRFAVEVQNDKRKQDSETIREAMQVASLLVLQNDYLDLKFITRTGLRPESVLCVGENEHPVHLREGTGVLESISFLTILSVIQAFPGPKVALLDELFSSVSPTNTLNISSKLNDLIDGKFQLILIEQKNEITQLTEKYRSFNIKLEDGTSKVVMQDIDKRSENNESICLTEDIE